MIDTGVVRDRLSAYHGTRVPASIARFVAWLAEVPEHAALLQERACLYAAYDVAAFADPGVPVPVRSTLRYDREPPEFMAFAVTGNDGEKIGVLELAPELARDELPFVTFFPMEFEAEVCLLGDELGAALAMYLAYPSVEGPRALELPGLFEKVLPAVRWPGFEVPAFPAPHGYRFVQTLDRVGVLAPADAFGPDLESLSYHYPKAGVLEAAIERATRLLSDGFPASAIAVAREVRACAESDLLAPACTVLRDAALMLRRPWHAAMVDEIVADERQRDRRSSASQRFEFIPMTVDDGGPWTPP